MPSYNLISALTDDPKATSLSLSASALIAVYRFKNPVTYDRKARKSYTDDLQFATVVKDRIEIVDDIRSLQVTSNKKSHLTTLSAQLLPTTDWEGQLLPGDFVFAWIAQDKETIRTVQAKLANGEPANEWEDGLKFFGRVAVCRKKRITGPDGHKNVSYVLSAAGFTELDMPIYYEPYMANQYKGVLSSWMHTLGLEINQYIESSRKTANGGIETHTILPARYEILFKKGIPIDLNADTSVVAVPQQTAGLDQRTMFTIPTPVGSVLGSYAQASLKWADLMELVVGVQKFTNEGVDPKKLFIPAGVFEGEKSHYTGTPLMGTFMPQVAAFTGNKSAWSVLEGFVNRAVNEMFVALKVNAKGRVVPTLTVRQLPYSSDAIDETYTPKDPLTPEQRNLVNKAQKGLKRAGGPETKAGKALLATYAKRYAKAGINPMNVALAPKPQMHGVTRFTELPRWVIPDILVKEVDIGRSDQGRINFIHVYGEAGQSDSLTKQFARHQPVRDDVDIARSGLRPLMATVQCSPLDVAMAGPEAWMNLLADIQMNAHLALNGIVNIYGTPAPVAPGDNIQFDGVIGHLEAVNHAFSVNIVGTPSFMTSLEFSHGVNLDYISTEDWFGISNPLNSVQDPATTIDGVGPTTVTAVDDVRPQSIPNTSITV